MLMLALVAYWPALQAGFVWDDDQYVTENPHIRTWDGLKRIWAEPGATPQYYPLVFTSFWLEHRLWGLEPAGYHVVNVLLHWACGVLLWSVLVRLGLDRRWSAAAALVFLVHPVHVESVAWVTERKNVLSLVFYLASALFMIRWLGLDGEQNPRGRLPAAYAAGLLLFVGALLSKTVTCSLPAALLLVIWWKSGRIRLREAAALIPFFILGAASGLLTVWLERTHVGAEGAEWSYGFLERGLIAGRVVWFYAGKLFWPQELMFNYPQWTIDAARPEQYLYPLGAIAVIAALWVLRRRLGRGPLAGVLFFCGTLFPALGFFNVYPFRFAFVADHFQYHASIGLIVVGVMAIQRLWKRAGVLPPRIPAGACLLAVLLLAWQTYRLCPMYKDLETLWTATIQKNPASWLAHTNLGNLLARSGRFEESIPHHVQAIRLRPDPEVAHNNLADALAKYGQIEQAEQHFNEALRINPRYALAYLNFGILKEAQGNSDEARQLCEQAVRLQPGYAEAHANLAQLLLTAGDLNRAETHFRSALRQRPDFEAARIGLGSVLAKDSKLDAARLEFAEALRRNPGSAKAHYNLGLVLNRLNRREEALVHFSRAAALDPLLAEAQHQAGMALAAAGRLDEAEERFRDAVKVKPEFAEAHLNLGLALGLQGKFEDSLQHLAEAVSLDPESAKARMRLAQGYWLVKRRAEAIIELEYLEKIDVRLAAELRAWMEKNGAS
jgi:tetratricopeptide (TPR) repeat protein